MSIFRTRRINEKVTHEEVCTVHTRYDCENLLADRWHIDRLTVLSKSIEYRMYRRLNHNEGCALVEEVSFGGMLWL